MVVVDTSVWVDYFKNKENSKTKLLEKILSSNKQIVLPGIIYVEILQGIKTDKKFNGAKEILDDFIFFPMDNKETYLKSIEIYRTCRKNGTTIRKTVDCLIASVVLENNFEFLHNDKDFDSISKFFSLKIVKMKPNNCSI
ncbi:MAG: PIN domain-containing protein [Candidatus Cloacimonetes bacterium]|nr:PIN domain-containing protein [Candidatus Cloacimonadota bacterium]